MNNLGYFLGLQALSVISCTVMAAWVFTIATSLGRFDKSLALWTIEASSVYSNCLIIRTIPFYTTFLVIGRIVLIRTIIALTILTNILATETEGALTV